MFAVQISPEEIYNANGTKAGEEIVISPLTDSGHSDASVTRLKDGGYIVAWGYFGVTGYDDTVYWQRFNANGTAAGTVAPSTCSAASWSTRRAKA